MFRDLVAAVAIIALIIVASSLLQGCSQSQRFYNSDYDLERDNYTKINGSHDMEKR